MRLFIENLKVRCIIGDEPWERKKPQEIRVDADLRFDARRAVLRDDVRYGVNYVGVADFLQRESCRRRARLIETLAEHLAQALKNRFRFQSVKISVSKRPRRLQAIFRAEAEC